MKVGVITGGAPMIVMKFGGTSVESSEAIERVAKIVGQPPQAVARGRGQRHGQSHRPASRHGTQSRLRRLRSQHLDCCSRCANATCKPRWNCSEQKVRRADSQTRSTFFRTGKFSARPGRRPRTHPARQRLPAFIRRIALQPDRGRCVRDSRTKCRLGGFPRMPGHRRQHTPAPSRRWPKPASAQRRKSLRCFQRNAFP